MSAKNRLLARVLVVKENLVVKSDSCNVPVIQGRRTTNREIKIKE